MTYNFNLLNQVYRK